MFKNTNLNLCGKFFLAISAFMLFPMGISLIYAQPDAQAFMSAIVIAAILGGAMVMIFKTSNRELRIRDGYVLVGLIWLSAGLLGALPFYFSGTVPTFVDALFESVSGFTTTGATIFSSIQDKPMGILLWRSLSHWLGGMGILVLSVAFLPRLGAGAMQLFRAEVPGPTAEKLLPRVAVTAKVLWALYIALTALLFFLLLVSGLDWFDAINHAFSTIASGGFSTRDASIASFANPWIEIIITVFMIGAGINFTLYYYAFNRRWSLIQKDSELRFYLASIGVLALLLGVSLVVTNTFPSIFESLRHGFFQVASIISTTGFSTADYGQWSTFARGLLMVLTFFGGSAGSTSGAIKSMRILIVLKFIFREFYRLLHPKIVKPVRIGTKVIPDNTLHGVTSFILLYLIIFALAGLAVTAMGIDTVTAFTGSAASISNVGPGFNLVGPSLNYSILPQGAKLIYITCMLLGRLEIFTFILFIAHPFMHIKQKIKLRR